jgi:hypothetical protein
MKVGSAGEAFFVEPTENPESLTHAPTAVSLLEPVCTLQKYADEHTSTNYEVHLAAESELPPPLCLLEDYALRGRSFSLVDPIPNVQLPTATSTETSSTIPPQASLVRRRSRSFDIFLEDTQATLTHSNSHAHALDTPPRDAFGNPLTTWWTWTWGALPVLREPDAQSNTLSTSAPTPRLWNVSTAPRSDIEQDQTRQRQELDKPIQHDSSTDTGNHGCSVSCHSPALSLCGDALSAHPGDIALAYEEFLAHRVNALSYSCAPLRVLADSRLVVCLCGLLVSGKTAQVCYVRYACLFSHVYVYCFRPR